MITPRRFDRSRFGAHPARAQRHFATVASVAMFVVILLGAAASSKTSQSAPDPDQTNRPAAARVVLVGTTTTAAPPDVMGESADRQPVEGEAVEGDTAPEDGPTGNSADVPADR